MSSSSRKSIAFLSFICISILVCSAQNFVPNYDEDKIPDYELADPLKFEDGRTVNGEEDWAGRREEIFSLFESQVYGKMPQKTLKVKVKVGREAEVLGGKAIRKEVFLTFKRKGKKSPSTF